MSEMPVRTPFGFEVTADDVLEGVDLSDKCVIVTGGGAGIGFETARALASAGAHVTVAVRRPDAARSAIEQLRELGTIEVAELDLADLCSVRSFAARWRGKLDILVNNAGIMATPQLERTPQGFELQFGTNYLGHFALSVWLRSSLSAANGARIVSVSSAGHQFSPVLFDDLGFDFLPYSPLVAYGQSKTANILMAVAVTRHWENDGIVCNALHPGAIATGLQKHTGGLKTPTPHRKTVEQGAATSVLLAASPQLEGVSGRYFEDCSEAPIVTRRSQTLLTGCAAYALDTANADRLWRLSHRVLDAD